MGVILGPVTQPSGSYIFFIIDVMSCYKSVKINIISGTPTTTTTTSTTVQAQQENVLSIIFIFLIII